MRSMTGFGRGSISENDMSIVVELKTVNNRFLDVNLRLPSELQNLETLIKRTISTRLARGRVDVNLQFDRKKQIAYESNRPLISGIVAAIRTMQHDLALPRKPDLKGIGRFPKVLTRKSKGAGPHPAQYTQ